MQKIKFEIFFMTAICSPSHFQNTVHQVTSKMRIFLELLIKSNVTVLTEIRNWQIERNQSDQKSIRAPANSVTQYKNTPRSSQQLWIRN